MSENLTLGALIDALCRCRPDASVRFDFCGFAPGTFRSYRGLYDHLAEHITVQQFLDVCRAQVGAVHEGYKGGDYTMGESTPVWVDFWGGCSGTMLVGVEQNFSTVYLITRNENQS